MATAAVKIIEVVRNGNHLRVLGTIDGVGQYLEMPYDVIENLINTEAQQGKIAQTLLAAFENNIPSRLDEMVGNLEIDIDTRQVTKDGKIIDILAKEVEPEPDPEPEPET